MVLENQDFLTVYFDLVVGLMESDQHRLRLMYGDLLAEPGTFPPDLS